MKNAIIINPKDNVVVAIEPIAKGVQIIYELDNTEHVLAAQENIPMYHKVARCDISKGEKLIKYGEYIGEAASNISSGMHVHTHNVLSVRERVVD